MLEELFPIYQEALGLADYAMTAPEYEERRCVQCPYDNVCCNVMVKISAIEAEMIVAYLKEQKLLHKYRDKIMKGRERARKLLLDENLELTWMVGPSKWGNTHRCTFYGDDGKCGIYEFRPIVCRLCYSHPTDPSCHENLTRMAFRILEEDPNYILGDASTEFAHINVALGELNTMLYRAIRHDWA